MTMLKRKKRQLAALILAAGRGERMNSDVVKVLHKAAGKSLIEHVLGAVRSAGVTQIAVVVGTRNRKDIRQKLSSPLMGEDKGGGDNPPILAFPHKGGRKIKVTFIEQKVRLGTGHAVLQAKSEFQNWPGDLLVSPADAPCIRFETIRDLVTTHCKSGAVASILTADVNDPSGYGRILRRGEDVIGIREHLDASNDERKITEINSGIYVFNAQKLFSKLLSIKQNSKKKEYYLTDVIEAFVRAGHSVRAHKIDDANEILGVNTRKELSVVHQILNEREIKRHAQAGVTILDPHQTVIAKGVKIGKDTIIHPFTWIESDVIIGGRCEIGPFAKIRSGSKIDDDVVIGSFVEVVRTKIGSKTLVKHLTYLGDAQVGKNVNVGAGSITANFNGKTKNKTIIRDGAFIGCDTIFIAPVTVGKRVKTGAGAVLPAGQNIPAGKTVVGIPAKLVEKHKRKKTK